MDDTKKRSSIPAKNGRCAPELYNELVDLESDNWATYLTAAKTLQITENELWVLLEVFDADPPLCQADIARRIHIPVQTLNSALSKMNRKGWIDFVPIPGSQKAKGVKLTQAGRKNSIRYWQAFIRRRPMPLPRSIQSRPEPCSIRFMPIPLLSRAK
ncbi:winged helix-turn-helix transcriptional regulator [Allobaculum sp. Allo2]|uniref:winged helix-turn-helix transcriptional regulator n=1 Tax=Allobaculum sp. Allo2 TaxID=2853432 RepID=UPI001F601E75|nr:winged helix-turn-helix transcriptional regulator [Allobaculum sp. Allo2]UNT92708.1 winged helix-turn-helix transcriptional regulator [Allobaculum sp. Allo2]